MANWYVALGGQQQGPFDDNTMRDMIARQEVGRDDTVWTDGMAEWTAAGRVQALAGLFNTAPSPQPIAYSQPFSSGGLPMLTDRAMRMLLATRPWVRIFSIMIFVVAGLMVLGGLVMIFGGVVSMGSGGRGGAAMAGGVVVGMGLVYLIIAGLYIMPGLYLSRYASRITSLERMRREDELERALEAQKSFWKFVGIATLVMIGLWLAMVGIMVVGGIAGASTMNSGSSSPTFTPSAPHIPAPPRVPVP